MSRISLPLALLLLLASAGCSPDDRSSVPEPRVTATPERLDQPIDGSADPGLLQLDDFRLERRAPVSFCGTLAFLGWRGMGGKATVSVWMKRPGWIEPRQLFLLPRHHYIQQLAFSPDGLWLAVLAMRYDRSVDENARDIFLLRAWGSRLRRLTDFGDVDGMAWSPASDRLAFTRARPGPGSIHVTDLAGKVVDLGPGQEPSWSPDGKRLVVSTATTPYPSYGDVASLAILSLDGARTTLTVPEDAADRYPQWSPDGRSIAFGRYMVGQEGMDGPFADIWMTDPSGTSETQVTNEADPYNGFRLGPWSPDSTELLGWQEADDWASVVKIDLGTRPPHIERPLADTRWSGFARAPTWLLGGDGFVVATLVTPDMILAVAGDSVFRVSPKGVSGDMPISSMCSLHGS